METQTTTMEAVQETAKTRKVKKGYKNLQKREAVILTSDLQYDIPLQDIEVVSLIDREKRDPKNPDDRKADGSLKKPYQGYRIKFLEDDIIVVIDAGSILAAGEEAFDIEEIDGNKYYYLVADQMGLEVIGKSARVILSRE